MDQHNLSAELINELISLRQRVVSLEQQLNTTMSNSSLMRIEQAKQEWESTVDALPQLVCVVDQQMQIVRANRTVERWGLGKVTQVRGQYLPHLLHPQEGSLADSLEIALYEAWNKVAQGEVIEWELEDDILKRYLYIQIRPTFVTVRPELKTNSFAAVIIHDITDRKRMEQAIQRMNEELEHRVEERTAALLKANNELLQEIVEREKVEHALRLSESRYRQQAAELHALHETSLRLNTQLELTELLNLIAEQVVALLQAEAAGLYIYNPQRDELRLEVVVGNFNEKVGATFESAEALVGKVFKQQNSAYSPDSKQMRAYAGMSHLETVLAIPLLGSSGVMGVLSIGSKRKQYFNEHDHWLTELFAAQAVVALENAHLHTETQNHAKQLAALNVASRVVVSTLDLDAVLKQIVVEIQTFLDAEDASVLLYDEETNQLRFAAIASAASDILTNMPLPPDAGFASWVVRQQKPVLIDNIQNDNRFYAGIDHLTGMTTRSLIAVPLVVKNKVIGVVEVINKAKGYFKPSDLDILDALASSAAIAIENARLYEAEREQFRRLEESQASLIQVEKMAALGRLVGSIAHEINNPLQSLQGFMSLLSEELAGRRRAEKINKYLEITDSEIERISAIVRRMRDFYRPTKQAKPTSSDGDSLGQFYRPNPTELKLVNLPEIMDSVLQLMNKKLQHSRVVIERRWEDDLPFIQGNPDHLRQVFLNLTLNATDAMSPSGGKLLIMITVTEAELLGQEPELVMQINFSDTGIGMTADVLSRIFEPLFTTKDQGSGFGLFTTYKIIEAHKGQITVESEVGLGTNFTILLPLEQSSLKGRS